MTKNQKPAKKKSAPSPNGRPTIGFLTAIRGIFFHHLMWCGVADAAREHNVNAICFTGNYVYDTEDFNAQANILYDLIDVEQLDGLIVWDLIYTMLDPDEIRQFYERYQPLPMVNIGRPVAGITNVQLDDYGGMRDMLVHLIEVHGCRRIAYIKGLPNYVPHDERYRAYGDVLAEYGLPFDPARVAVPRDTAEVEQPDWGRTALCRLLDEQKADFDALVTTNDRFSHVLLPELQARGIRVPGDIALVSCDDDEGSNCLTPPLTTVPIPLYGLGRVLAETLLAKLEGQKVLEQVTVPSLGLIVRQSCGCLNPKVTQVVAGPVTRTETAEPLEVSLVGQRERIVAEMMQAAESAVAGLTPNWAEQLLNGFVAALTTAEAGETSIRFLSTLDDILRQVLAAEGDVEVWPQVLSNMRRQLLPYLSIDEAGTLYRAEDLWLQAHMMIEEVGQRVQASRDLQAAQRKRILGEIATALATNFDVNDLGDILARELPRLGISRGYLSLYEAPRPYQYPQPAPQWSRLVLAYDQENPAGSQRVALEAGGRRFPSRQLVPPELLPQQGVYSLIVHALYFQDEQIGFMLLDGGRRDGDVYEMLRAQISSTLQGALLVQQVRQHSAELARKQYILDTFMTNIPDAIYFKDRDSRIIQTNQAHARAFGLTDPGELVGKSDIDLFPEDTARPKYEQEQDIIRTGQPLLNLEEPFAGGRWTLTTKMPLRDEHGAIIGTFGISRDITQLKTTEAALHEAKETAEAANRAKSEFLANMSHELRTPLNGILGYAQILKRDPDLLPRQQEAVDIIQQSGQHLLTLITDILDVAKIEAGKLDLLLAHFNFPKFLDGIVDLIRMQAQDKGLEFRYDSPPQLPAGVYADERRLRQILLNLLWNAVKFTERGSVTFRIVDVGFEILDFENSSSASINQQSQINNLKFEISDTGIGMTPEQLSVIFRPFEQVGNQMSRMGGTGLGLAISRQLVHLMGGEIQVRSVFGQGSTFWFELPVSVAQAGPYAIPAPERTVIGYRGTQQQALIVDNDLTNRRVLTDLLHAVGFECVEAEHGLDALEKARARRPDVILLDLFMPIMNGFETIRQLRQDPALADVVVIAVSASTFDSDQARSLSAGCQAFLSKPVDDRRLFQELETHLKLEWRYQERSADDAALALRPELPCVFPPRDEVKHLHELSLRGDLFGVQERAAALEEEDATFRPFVAKLTQLAKAYQDEPLLAFLERGLKEESD